VADDAPVRAALLGRGPDRDRWRAWLSAAGVQVVLCDHLAAAAALVPRPSVVVVDTAALDAAEGGGAIGPVGVPVVLLDDLVAPPMGSGPATRLSRTASRAALVGAVLAVSAGLQVSPQPGTPPGGARTPGHSEATVGRVGRVEATEADVTGDDWWSESPTPREREVVELVALGLTNRAIASRLGLSAHTVKFHLASIYAKLGASGRTQAVRRAVRRGWITI
jgi:DNA-binding CsgD family transcriptional regulator